MVIDIRLSSTLIEHGQEKKIILDGLSAKEIEQQLATLVK